MGFVLGCTFERQICLVYSWVWQCIRERDFRNQVSTMEKFYGKNVLNDVYSGLIYGI